MQYKIKTAIVEKNKNTGQLNLVDPEGSFVNKDKLMVIDNEDFITIQLLVNAILRNDFKAWKTIDWENRDSFKTLLVKLGYGREDISRMLQEF